jgi:hypothetical protein
LSKPVGDFKFGWKDRRSEVRQRATSSEWAAYYKRMSEIRRRFGDPFQQVVERSHRRGRYLRIVGIALSVVIGSVLVVGVLWLFNNPALRGLLSDAVARPPD